jgi:hypothetical protein
LIKNTPKNYHYRPYLAENRLMAENITPKLTEFHITIDSDGRWFHEGGEITRKRMVALFATILSCDETGQHWLRTPVEYGPVEVADAAFIITAMHSEQTEDGQVITMTDNIDRQYELGGEFPLEIRTGGDGAIKPYLILERGVRARLSHPVYYELANLAEHNTDGMLGITSHQHFFSLETTDIPDSAGTDR